MNEIRRVRKKESTKQRLEELFPNVSDKKVCMEYLRKIDLKAFGIVYSVADSRYQLKVK